MRDAHIIIHHDVQSLRTLLNKRKITIEKSLQDAIKAKINGG